MTSLLRASRLASASRQSRQRRGVLGNHHYLSFQSTRPSFSSWAPAAYRAPRSSTAHHKQSGGNHARHGYKRPRGGKHKIGRGRDGIWQELQQIYGNNTPEKEENETESWKLRRDYHRQEQLSQANQEFRALIHRYRNALFPDSSNQTKGSMMKLLQQLHSLCEQASSSSTSNIDDDDDDDDDDDKKEKAVLVVSMDSIVATEDQFRDIGALTRTLISLYARMVNEENDDRVPLEKNSAMAEHLLRGLIQLKQDRQVLIQRAKEQQALEQQQESAKQTNNGVLGWIKGVFVSSSSGDDDSDDTKDNNQETETLATAVLAHEEASFGPTKRQYAQVIKSLRRDLNAHSWQVPDTAQQTSRARIESTLARETQLSIANQMSALLQLHLEQGGAPSTSLTLPILQAYSQVGSLYAADEARRIYIGPCQRKIPQEGFHSVLRAYSLAALMEETPDARAKAAMTATSLLKDREGATYSGNAPLNLFEEQESPRGGESYRICLETLLRAGEQAVPNRISLAEALLKRYLGEKTFDQVVGNRKAKSLMPSKVDISVFESLLFLYEYAVKRGEAKYLNMAKSILESAQAAQQASSTQAKEKSESTPVNGKEQSVFPSTKSYNSLLSAMKARVGVLYNDLQLSKDTAETKKSMRKDIENHIDYATGILDHMTATCPPDLSTFELLLDLLTKSESPEREQRAQEIMSRMSIRQACNTWSDSSRVYSSLLQCWAVGPEASSFGNLHRSLRILDKMEAESGIQHLPGSNVSDTEQEIFDSVYEQNEMESYKNAYNGALKICSNCQEESEAAFDAAFDIYNRMIAANVQPDGETFEYLFATCLLPGEDEAVLSRRRDLAGTVIAFASDHGIETKDMHKQLRSIAKSSKNTKQRKPRRKAKSIN